MTAESAGHAMWSPNPIKQRHHHFFDAAQVAGDSDEELVLTAPFEIRLPIRDITP